MSVFRIRRGMGAKWWAVWTAQMLVIVFVFAAFTVWQDDSTIHLLGYAALGVMLILFRALVVLGRRTAGAGGKRPVDLEAAKRSNRVFRTVGIALVLLGIVLVAVGFLSHSGAILGLSLGGAITGIVLVRHSFDRAPSPDATSGEEAVPKTISRFDHLMRAAGIALVPLAVFSFASLFLYGYHAAWPLYTFVAVGLASLLVWPYLLARAYGRWLKR